MADPTLEEEEAEADQDGTIPILDAPPQAKVETQTLVTLSTELTSQIQPVVLPTTNIANCPHGPGNVSTNREIG